MLVRFGAWTLSGPPPPPAFLLVEADLFPVPLPPPQQLPRPVPLVNGLPFPDVNGLTPNEVMFGLTGFDGAKLVGLPLPVPGGDPVPLPFPPLQLHSGGVGS